jgi:hypothetical protein
MSSIRLMMQKPRPETARSRRLIGRSLERHLPKRSQWLMRAYRTPAAVSVSITSATAASPFAAVLLMLDSLYDRAPGHSRVRTPPL